MVFSSKVNSCPSLTRWTWESFGCFPWTGHPGLRGLDWSSLVSESSGIWTCGWWLSQIGKTYRKHFARDWFDDE